MAPLVSELVIIFRTHSDVEASIVRGLLEAHGVPVGRVVGRVPHSLFPLTVNELGEVRIAVHAEEADEARRIIDSHRTEAARPARWCGCATSSRRCSARSTTASAIAACSSTR